MYLEEYKTKILEIKQSLLELGKPDIINRYYQDKKYVKQVGHDGYVTILRGLDTFFAMRGVQKKGKKRVEWYERELYVVNKKLSEAFAVAYDTFHMSMHCDGNQDMDVAIVAFKKAEEILDGLEKIMDDEILNKQTDE
ncbi:MAG: DUF5618 family protein [Chitinophagaceae bacterium]|nr:DUF5618 family protein [Chitinophagaceae bacterium]